MMQLNPDAKVGKSFPSVQACTFGAISGSGGKFDNFFVLDVFFTLFMSMVSIAQHENLPITSLSIKLKVSTTTRKCT